MMNNKGIQFLITSFIVLGLLFLVSCQSVYRTKIDNSPGRRTIYEPVDHSGSVQSVGIESQDVVKMTDKMMRDMLKNHTLAAYSDSPPRVIIDAEYFRNEGSQRINKNIIADRLRIELNRAASNRMVFIARHAVEMVEHEKQLKRKSVVDHRPGKPTPTTIGADYRLTGSIKDINQINPSSGLRSRYVQITFEMVDLDNSKIVWSGMYEFKKSAQNDIIYR